MSQNASRYHKKQQREGTVTPVKHKLKERSSVGSCWKVFHRLRLSVEKQRHVSLVDKGKVVLELELELKPVLTSLSCDVGCAASSKTSHTPAAIVSIRLHESRLRYHAHSSIAMQLAN